MWKRPDTKMPGTDAHMMRPYIFGAGTMATPQRMGGVIS